MRRSCGPALWSTPSRAGRRGAHSWREPNRAGTSTRPPGPTATRVTRPPHPAYREPMTEASTPAGAPRVSLAGISSRAYEHPADRSALVALRAVPGFDTVLKALSGLIHERSHRLTYLASAVKVSDSQFKDIHAMYAELVEIFDLPETPDLF